MSRNRSTTNRYDDNRRCEHEKFTRIFVFLSTAICIFFTPLHSFAANEQTMNLADQILSSVNNTQEIVVSEKEMIAELCKKELLREQV